MRSMPREAIPVRSLLTPAEQEAWMNGDPWTPYHPLAMAAAALGTVLLLVVLFILITRFG